MSIKKVTRTNGPNTVLDSIFDWRIETDSTTAKLMLTVLVRNAQKPSFAVTVSDDAAIWTVYLSESSFRTIDANSGVPVSQTL